MSTLRIAACLMTAGLTAFGQAKPDEKAKPADEKAKPAKTDKNAFTDTFPDDRSDLGPTGANPYFILVPGDVLEFAGMDKDKPVHLFITVLEETRKVDGVETRVIEERESEGDALVEVSRNFYAISKKTNNVYYFGEEVDMYKDGKVSGHEGTWLAGEKGARYGLMMPGTPLLGGRHYQEIAPDVAMDRAEIVSMTETMETPAGKFERVLKVVETTPLEKGKESKYYAPGVGLLKDGKAKLVKHVTK